MNFANGSEQWRRFFRLLDPSQLTHAVHGGPTVHHATLNGAHEIATNANRTPCESSSRRREAAANSHLKDSEALRLVNGGGER
jgi:hypothetical protein